MEREIVDKTVMVDKPELLEIKVLMDKRVLTVKEALEELKVKTDNLDKQEQME